MMAPGCMANPVRAPTPQLAATIICPVGLVQPSGPVDMWAPQKGLVILSFEEAIQRQLCSFGLSTQQQMHMQTGHWKVGPVQAQESSPDLTVHDDISELNTL